MKRIKKVLLRFLCPEFNNIKIELERFKEENKTLKKDIRIIVFEEEDKVASFLKKSEYKIKFNFEDQLQKVLWFGSPTNK